MTQSPGPEVTIDSFQTFDLSATYLKDMGNGTIKLRAYGTDILDGGNRIGRRYDAGSFRLGRTGSSAVRLVLALGYEF